ncbi:bifunctional 2',3'-cyclic-nucleotide 2'-phosphodiesterase/3'-nucleotidase [Plastorhodobacter daqingensis]|uniref:Bifunctional 2',3'-cyclic-nucleotide 2'-phosphodiesterase/3'-nucleotidase n=1 Tax=Plastorhodobacter daqingensis TaxID=1387281 RepID=A0ABW2UM13_9RHOB
MTNRSLISGRSDAPLVQLRVLETTDLHLNLLPFDYYTNRPHDSFSLAQAATLIAQLRKEVSNSLLFDNGDFLQGTPMGDYVAQNVGPRPGEIHPAIAAMNAIGYDAATLGNHEFNYGLPFLQAALAEAAFPLVCANVLTHAGVTPSEDIPLVAPYRILDRQVLDEAGRPHPLRIGVIGFAPPQIDTWDKAQLQGCIVTRDIVQSARFWVPEMKRAGADIVLALCHSGIAADQPEHRAEDAALPLAAVAGIDALLIGHSHLTFPSPCFAGVAGVDAELGTLAGKPAVMAGSGGSHVGVIDLVLERLRCGWRIADYLVRVAPVRQAPQHPPLAQHPAVVAAAAPAHAGTLAYIREPVGLLKVPLHSYFASVMATPALGLVGEAQREDVEAALADTELALLPVLSAVSTFKAGGRSGPGYFSHISPGTLALRSLSDIYTYPNTLQAVRVTGAGLRRWLERSAAFFRTISPGARDIPLIEPDFPCYNFDTILGLTYDIDLSRPPLDDQEAPGAGTGRITNLRYRGRLVSPSEQFIVATNDYRAAGSGGILNDAEVIYSSRRPVRDILRGHVTARGPLAPAAPKVWRFRPMPGATVTFRTSPQAVHHLGELPLVAEYLGENDDGFAEVRLHL